MNLHYFGNPEADTILIQAIDERSLSLAEEEAGLIRKMSSIDFYMVAVIVDDWFIDLSPWKAPAVYGNDSFGDGAEKSLEFILGLCSDNTAKYYLGGYSLSGLFALWAAYQTSVFTGIAAVSPSLWFPHFSDYMENHHICCDRVYLSIGDKEGKTRNKVMSSVDDNIRIAYDTLKSRSVDCILEYNRGNHFTDVEKRCARAFSRVIDK